MAAPLHHAKARRKAGVFAPTPYGVARPWGKLDRERRRAEGALRRAGHVYGTVVQIVLTSGICSCYVLIIAGWRRADERRRTAVPPRKKGNRRIGSIQAGVADAAGTKGWRPSVDIGSKRVRPGSGRYFSCSPRASCLDPTLGSLLSRGRDQCPSDPPISKTAAERRRLKKARKSLGSSVKNRASPSA